VLPARDIDFADLILRFTAQVDMAVTEKQAQLLSRHLQIMLAWNSRLNLTRITGSKEMIVQHLLDSILPSKFLPSSGWALDVGTGAGFPGIPLKIIHPGLEFILLDSNRKKISFLAAVSAALGLKGVQSLHARWQAFLNDEGHARKFGMITTRALKLDPELINGLAPRVLAPGGVLAHWRSQTPHTSGQSADFATDASGCHDMEYEGEFEYALPGIEHPRAIQLWRRIN
jgi:16S rRNA (guanine527-N7)-methyltransferase